MDDSNKSRREETREFWEAAIRLWNESGLSVRGFCRREGLAEHAFYSWRRKLLHENAVPDIEEPPVTSDGESPVVVRRRRRQKQVGADDAFDATVAAPFVELVAPTHTAVCRCTLELERTAGAKMRIELRSAAMPDLVAISQSFWNHSS